MLDVQPLFVVSSPFHGLFSPFVKFGVERFWDNTRWMIEFSVLRTSTAYGSPGEEMRLFLTEDGYQAALQSQQRREIKIKRYARLIEGHILDFKPEKRRRS